MCVPLFPLIHPPNGKVGGDLRYRYTKSTRLMVQTRACSQWVWWIPTVTVVTTGLRL